MVMYDLSEDLESMKAMFRCVLMKHGDMFVKGVGTTVILKLSVHNLAFQHQVSRSYLLVFLIVDFNNAQILPIKLDHIMELVMEKYG